MKERGRQVKVMQYEKDIFSPEPLERKNTAYTLILARHSFQSSDLQNYKMINVCFCKLLTL